MSSITISPIKTIDKRKHDDDDYIIPDEKRSKKNVRPKKITTASSIIKIRDIFVDEIYKLPDQKNIDLWINDDYMTGVFENGLFTGKCRFIAGPQRFYCQLKNSLFFDKTKVLDKSNIWQILGMISGDIILPLGSGKCRCSFYDNNLKLEFTGPDGDNSYSGTLNAGKYWTGTLINKDINGDCRAEYLNGVRVKAYYKNYATNVIEEQSIIDGQCHHRKTRYFGNGSNEEKMYIQGVLTSDKRKEIYSSNFYFDGSYINDIKSSGGYHKLYKNNQYVVIKIENGLPVEISGRKNYNCSSMKGIYEGTFKINISLDSKIETSIDIIFEDLQILTGRGKILFNSLEFHGHYDGTFKDGCLSDGRGYITNAFGYFDGSWVLGQAHTGEVKGSINQHPSKFKGKIKDRNYYEGTGLIIGDNGCYFDGQMKNGRYWNGKGRLMLDNNLHDGSWKDGNYIGDIKLVNDFPEGFQSYSI